MAKTFVGVIMEHDINGKITPLKITWTDGRQFTIDRVLDVRQAGAMKSGGMLHVIFAIYMTRKFICSAMALLKSGLLRIKRALDSEGFLCAI